MAKAVHALASSNSTRKPAPPLRTGHSPSRKQARRIGKHPHKGKPRVPGAQFIARDQILPLDRMVFGLVEPDDRSVRIFRVEKYVSINDPVVLVWKRSKSWLTGRYIRMEVKQDGARRVALQTLGWDPTDPKPKRYGQPFEWYDLAPEDLIAIEVGRYYPTEAGQNLEPQTWPDAYQAVKAPELSEWERRQQFTIPNPPSSPWAKWDTLHIDPIAPIGSNTWVAGFPLSAGSDQEPILGPVRRLKQSFTVTDVRTGKDERMGSNYAFLYGAVVGLHRRMLNRDRMRRRLSTASRASVER